MEDIDTTNAYIDHSDGRRHQWDIGSYGYGSWYWGIEEATAEVARAVLGDAADDKSNPQARLVHNLEHYVEECSDRHSRHDWQECEICQWIHDDADSLIDWLNARTHGAAWLYDNGELYLVAEDQIEEFYG